jgi:hypothetical protein
LTTYVPGAADEVKPTTEPSDSQSTLTAFVPRLAVELGKAPIPSWTSVEGSMLSADISGFTALSEKLAGKGKAGAEEITSLINTCFTALIETKRAETTTAPPLVIRSCGGPSRGRRAGCRR